MSYRLTARPGGPWSMMRRAVRRALKRSGDMRRPRHSTFPIRQLGEHLPYTAGGRVRALVTSSHSGRSPHRRRPPPHCLARRRLAARVGRREYPLPPNTPFTYSQGRRCASVNIELGYLSRPPRGGTINGALDIRCAGCACQHSVSCCCRARCCCAVALVVALGCARRPGLLECTPFYA